MGSNSQVNHSNPLITIEHKTHDDILQGTFLDTYQTVTYKVLMGLKFVKHFCSTVKFIVVIDDDSVALPWNLFHMLPDTPDKLFYAGISNNREIVRDEKSNWYTPYSDYLCHIYPEFFAGALFVLSYATAVQLYDASKFYKYFRLDDVFIGGLAEDLLIPKTYYDAHYYTNSNMFLETDNLNESELNDIIVCHHADKSDVHHLLWRKFCYYSISNTKKQSETVLIEYCKLLLTNDIN